MNTVKNSIVTGQWLEVSLLISGSSSFPRGWRLVYLSRNIRDRLHGIFASFVIYRFYKLLFRSSCFTCFPVMILPTQGSHPWFSEYFKQCLHEYFVCIHVPLTSLHLSLYLREGNSSFRKMLKVAD